MSKQWQAGSFVRLRQADLTWRELDGEIVALDLATSVYVATNKSGAVLWHVLREGATVDTLARRLVEHFDIGVDQARRDVDGFLEVLAHHRLLDRGAVPATTDGSESGGKPA